MKLYSWNVNSIGVRLERLLRFLEREKPDVLCLQELKCVDEKFPTEAIRQAGYRATVHGQKTYNGVAVLTREEPQAVTRGFGDGGDDGAARFLGVTVRGVRVYSAYVPNGQAVGSEKYAYKLEWLRRLRAYLDGHYTGQSSVIVAGDFNVAPEDRDVHDPKAWHEQILCSTAERRALAHVCGFGLQDTYRKLVAEGGHYSWWDYRMLGFPKNRGLRIDLILATAPLHGECRAVFIDRDERKGAQPSDHAPVGADFAAGG